MRLLSLVTPRELSTYLSIFLRPDLADKVAVSFSTLLMDLVTLTLVLMLVPFSVSTRLYVTLSTQITGVLTVVARWIQR
jgi:hypothetical protein